MSSSIEDKLEQLNLSNDEMKSISEAFKKEEFRKLFAEYAQEISDPENRARYEREIGQLENERGMDVKFVKPTPGHVLKTTVNGNIKGFINVGQNENVGKPSSQKKMSDNGKQGLSWSIPHLFAPPREDFAKDKQKCLVYDFVVHPDTYRLGDSNVQFRKMINDMAIDGVEKMFNVELDHKNVKSLKMKYKGDVSSTVIRNKLPDSEVKERDEDDILNQMPYPYGSETTEEKTQKIMKENAEKNKTREDKEAKTKMPHKEDKNENREKANAFTEPKYETKYQSHIDYQDFIQRQDVTMSTRPQNLLLIIHLPLINSAAALTLDVFPERVVLVSHRPAKYKLDLALPYKIDEEASGAKFDKMKHTLSLTLPVIPAEPSKVSFISDGGINEDEDVHCELDINSEGGEREEVLKVEVANEHTFSEEEKIEGEQNKREKEKIKKASEVNVSDVKTGADSGIEDNTPTIEESSGGKDGREVADDGQDYPASSLPGSESKGDEQKSEECENGSFLELKEVDKKEDQLGGVKNGEDQVGGVENGEDQVGGVENGEDQVGGVENGEDQLAGVENGEDQLAGVENGEDQVGGVENGEDQVGGVENGEDQVGGVENGEEIVVVHENECPKLHGILKSRTSSESSSSQESGEESSPQSPSPTSSFASKKSVSFSDHVDETVYRINQSVSTLHATLKNRKKKKEKRQAIKQKQEARRRKNSGSMSSGDEHFNHHHHHHVARQHRYKKVNVDHSNKVDSDDDPANNSESVLSSDQVNSDPFQEHEDNHSGSENNSNSNVVERKVVEECDEQNVGRGRKRRSRKGRKFKDAKFQENKNLVEELSTTDAQRIEDSKKPRETNHEPSKPTSPSPCEASKPTPPASCEAIPADHPDTMLSWKDPVEGRKVSCPIQLENDQVFSLDFN